MGKASISIAISGSYNGRALERAQRSLDNLALKAAAAEGSVSKSWSEAGGKVAQAGGEIYNAGRAAADAGDMLTTHVSLPLAAVGAAAVTTAADFESSMSRVAGALNDPTADMEALRELAIQTGQETVFSASDAANAMEELAKGGMSAADIQGGALATTMDLAAAGSLDLATAANTVVASMGAFQLTADESGEAANALAGAAAASSADVSDLTQALQQSSAQANAVGWSIQDTSAVLASFADAGIRGSDAGTSLRTMLQRLAAPTGAAASTMEELGIEVRDSDGSMKDAASIAEELSTALGGVDAATRDAALQTIFGADASRAALIMMNQGREGIERYTAATNDQTAAQRLADSQMGETERAIEEMRGSVETAGIALGTALVPFVTQAAGVVGGLADAFSSLDGDTQSTIATLGLVAAAAGPVLSIAGRFAQVVGNGVTAVGRAQQTVASYADALTTTNVASLKAYSATGKMNAALDANPAVKAAGGVDNYVAAVQRANTATSDYDRAVRNLNREYAKGEKASVSQLTALQDTVSVREQEMRSAQGTVDSYNAQATASKKSATAVKAQATAMAAASKAGTMLKTTLAAVGPALILTAAVAGISAFASAMEEARERAENMETATTGLVEATEVGAISSERGAAALDDYGESAKSAAEMVAEATESHVQLVDTINDNNLDASGQLAQLDRAYEVIQQYANQTNLSTTEQGRLKTAVETVNQMCGTQVSVVDAVNGVLADENGRIQDVTGSLGGYIEAKKRQIQADAQMSNLSALYTQQQEDIAALTAAQQDYQAALEDVGSKADWVADYMEDYGASAEQAEAAWEGMDASLRQSTGLTEAQNNLEATNQAIDNTETGLAATEAAAEGATESIQLLAQASPEVTAAVGEIGGSTAEFADALADAGISATDFASLSGDQIAQLVAAWDNGAGDIATAAQNLGIDMSDAGVNAATALANGLQSGSVSVDTATSILEAAATGDWSGVQSQMEAAGISLPQSVADGITANGYAASGATDRMLSLVALQLTGGDVDAAAEILGHDIDAGLAEGITSGTLSEEEAEMLGQDVIDAAKTQLESHSPSQAFYRIGSDIDAGLGQGIEGNASGPLGSLGSLIGQMLGISGQVPGKMLTSGYGGSTSLASGLSMGAEMVMASASGLSGSATGGVAGLPGQMGTSGSQASSRFASGIGAGQSRTRSEAANLSKAAEAMGNGDSYQWGSHMSINFASGIKSGRSWVSSAAEAIANAAKAAIGFSVPEEGPFSGREKGGETSGLHLAQNFAQGMVNGIPYVSRAAADLMGAADLSSSPGSGAASGPTTLDAILAELRAIRAEIGPDIAKYTPRMDQRQMRRTVQQYG